MARPQPVRTERPHLTLVQNNPNGPYELEKKYPGWAVVVGILCYAALFMFFFWSIGTLIVE